METIMSIFSVAGFNEAHQKALGYSPNYGQPVELSRPPFSRVRVSLFVEGEEFIGEGTNQRLARQEAVDAALSAPGRLPRRLFQLIDDSI